MGAGGPSSRMSSRLWPGCDTPAWSACSTRASWRRGRRSAVMLPLASNSARPRSSSMIAAMVASSMLSSITTSAPASTACRAWAAVSTSTSIRRRGWHRARAAAMASVAVRGVDFHIGSQLTSVEPFVDALERTLAEAPGYLGGIATHPLFSRIHEDPRWQPFVQKAGQSAEQLAEIEFDLKLPH